MNQDDPSPKLQVDSDWKAEAQAEKERLAQQEEAKAESGEGRPGELPEASFKTLMGVLASQAIMGLGAMGDPKTGRVMIDLDGAKFNIDLLEVLDEKTKGNLDDDEANDLTQVLTELRSRFVHVAQLVAQQGAAPPEAGAGGEPSPSVIMPDS